MTYSKTSSTATLCTATITRKKNRVKSYGSSASVQPLQYFLKDGEEFEVELFNPHTIQVLARIKINGTPISSSGVVLMPGQRVFLERFIDTNEKFIFKTYEVEDSKEAKAAVAKNGDILVEFFHERIKTPYVPLNIVTYPTITWPSVYPYGGPYWYYGGSGSTLNSPYNMPFGSTLTNTVSNCNINTDLNNISFTTSSLGGGTTTSNCFYSSSDLGSNITMDSLSLNEELTKSVETGRIAGGTASNQTFETVYGDFNTYSTNTISMKLLPDSQKPVEVSEIRSYCPGCRSRIKKTSWKFCPSCGEDLS